MRLDSSWKTTSHHRPVTDPVRDNQLRLSVTRSQVVTLPQEIISLRFFPWQDQLFVSIFHFFCAASLNGLWNLKQRLIGL